MLVKHRGKWALQIGTGAQRRRYSTGIPATAEGRPAAERAARDIERSLVTPEDDTVGSIVPAYIADAVQRDVADVDRLRYAWKRLAPTFAAMAPKDITRDACRRYVATRREAGIGDGTIGKELNVLRAALRWYDKNTPAVVEAPAHPEPRDRWLTRGELVRLLEAAEGVRHLEVFIHLAVATAARKSALLELTWMQVDFQRGQIFLGRKANGKKRATVPMTNRLRDLLKEVQRENVSGHVVEYNGRPVADVKKAFNAAVERAGIDDFHIHDLRHTAAVWMAGAGVPMSKISQYLGHSSTAVTERIYARYAPDHLRDAASALEI